MFALLAVWIQKLMEAYNVPGLSLAIIDNFKLASAQAFGVTEAGGTTPVNTRTLFQAGSISKPVAAVGALNLVERGKLSLDDDVNQKLRSWGLASSWGTRCDRTCSGTSVMMKVFRRCC